MCLCLLTLQHLTFARLTWKLIVVCHIAAAVLHLHTGDAQLAVFAVDHASIVSISMS